MLPSFTWRVGVCLFVLNLLESERLVDLAAVGLEEGLESENLRRLASTATDSHALRSLFDRALVELAVDVPGRREAAVEVARAIASQILNGAVGEIEGARQIASVSRAAGPHFHELDVFIYAESEAEDRPAEREFFSNEIRSEARRLLSRPDNGMQSS